VELENGRRRAVAAYAWSMVRALEFHRGGGAGAAGNPTVLSYAEGAAIVAPESGRRRADASSPELIGRPARGFEGERENATGDHRPPPGAGWLCNQAYERPLQTSWKPRSQGPAQGGPRQPHTA